MYYAHIAAVACALIIACNPAVDGGYPPPVPVEAGCATCQQGDAERLTESACGQTTDGVRIESTLDYTSAAVVVTAWTAPDAGMSTETCTTYWTSKQACSCDGACPSDAVGAVRWLQTGHAGSYKPQYCAEDAIVRGATVCLSWVAMGACR